MTKEKQPAHHQLSFTKEERDFIDQKLGSIDRKSRIEAITKLLLEPISQNQQTTKEKLEKVKLANETLKVWKDIRVNGGTVNDLERLVNHGEIPQLQNNYEESTPEEKPKIEFKTFGQTITHKPKKILQDDGSLRCMRCNKTIDMRAFDFEQLDDYKKHVEDNHGKLFESERKELMGIYPS